MAVSSVDQRHFHGECELGRFTSDSGLEHVHGRVDSLLAGTSETKEVWLERARSRESEKEASEVLGQLILINDQASAASAFRSQEGVFTARRDL